jgi:hypothetical protein
VFIGNLSDDVTERDIREVFRRCGPIKEIRWLEDRKTGKFRGYSLSLHFFFISYHSLILIHSFDWFDSFRSFDPLILTFDTFSFCLMGRNDVLIID